MDVVRQRAGAIIATNPGLREAKIIKMIQKRFPDTATGTAHTCIQQLIKKFPPEIEKRGLLYYPVGSLSAPETAASGGVPVETSSTRSAAAARDLPPVGTPLFHTTLDGRKVEAIVTTDGILYKAKTYRTLGGAARAAAAYLHLTRAQNGWVFWGLKNSGIPAEAGGGCESLRRPGLQGGEKHREWEDRLSRLGIMVVGEGNVATNKNIGIGDEADVVWWDRDSPGTRPLAIFEIELSGRIRDAVGRLDEARKKWGTRLFLFVPKRDREKAEARCGARTKRYLTIVTIQDCPPELEQLLKFLKTLDPSLDH